MAGMPQRLGAGHGGATVVPLRHGRSLGEGPLAAPPPVSDPSGFRQEGSIKSLEIHTKTTIILDRATKNSNIKYHSNSIISEESHSSMLLQPSSYLIIVVPVEEAECMHSHTKYSSIIV